MINLFLYGILYVHDIIKHNNNASFSPIMQFSHIFDTSVGMTGDLMLYTKVYAVLFFSSC